ncbi:hypothetical protein BDN70DRAFT_874079 [Pholiota conissans]|uniref:Uncharacterized protein n=1 Tax=Pholiota conissans TaxID=109636 RepID=A0A9P6D528_9AGAR|nr:hypothetical protein BDN70DRAFT_874079 [Pholiota conissans]
MSLTNVTIDDAGNSTAGTILYSPPLCNGSGWTVKEGQGLGGSYRFCASSNKTVTPSATFSFTGVAVYYMSPYFPGSLMNITIDGSVPHSVNLSNPAGQTGNLSDPAIIWSAINLNNTQHSIELLPANGSRTLNVDAFIITQVQNNVTAGPTSGNSTPISPIPGDSASLGLSVQSAATTRLSIGLGVTFGVLSFLIFVFISIFLARRQRKLKDQFRWVKTIPPLHPEDYADPDMAATRGFTQSKVSYVSQKTSRLDDNALAMRALPNRAHGSSPANDYEGDVRSELGAKGHDDDVPPLRPVQSPIKYEPARTATSSSLVGPRPRSASTSTRGNGAPVSRQPTFTSTRLEPVRASASSQPSSFNQAAFVKEKGSMSRSTTFSSTRLEPVR